MDRHDYHFISTKFLTAIILALFFAFLLIYVFTPQEREDYRVYSFEKESVARASEFDFLTEADYRLLEFPQAERDSFNLEAQNRSFNLMEASKNSVLAVITANYFEQMNGIREEKMRSLAQKELELRREEERLVQEKRRELEATLSQQLQQLRQDIRRRYSDVNQEQIRANYLRILNLRIKLEVVVETQAERNQVQAELDQVRAEQDELLAERNLLYSQDLSQTTQSLIMEFNQNYASYRDQIRRKHQEILSAEREEIEYELVDLRSRIRVELAQNRELKAEKMDQLIAEVREKYFQ